MDESLIKHGTRVSYIMSKMLDCKGDMRSLRLQILCCWGVLHDIGAYKTDDVRKQLTYEAKNPVPHSIYGYLSEISFTIGRAVQDDPVSSCDTDKLQDVDYQYKPGNGNLKSGRDHGYLAYGIWGKVRLSHD